MDRFIDADSKVSREHCSYLKSNMDRFIGGAYRPARRKDGI